MGMSLYVVAVDAETLETLTAESAVGVLLEGWSADKLGWAVGGLLFGHEGIGRFGHSESDRFGPEVQVMQEITLLEVGTNSPDTYTLRARFRDGIFGVALGPVPQPDDEEWLLDAAKQLRDLLKDAYASEKTVLFGFF